MASARAKTINLLLYEGDLGGVISIEDSSWNSGELYSAPRESVMDLFKTDACNKYGVYMLLSKEKVYVGQSSDLSKRISQHIVGKDWWENVVILTTSDNRFNHADIDYLEAILINKAINSNSLDCDNKNKGNDPKISKFQKVSLDQYLDEAMFLMELIGITVFNEKKNSMKIQESLFNAVDVKTKLSVGKRAKKEAINFLKDKGIDIGKYVSYAVRQENKDDCWANPNVEMLNKDWDVVLNNNIEKELVVLHVPQNSFDIRSEKRNGLLVRSDKTELIDLHIDVYNFHDVRSGLDFSKYIVEKISY